MFAFAPGEAALPCGRKLASLALDVDGSSSLHRQEYLVRERQRVAVSGPPTLQIEPNATESRGTLVPWAARAVALGPWWCCRRGRRRLDIEEHGDAQAARGRE